MVKQKLTPTPAGKPGTQLEIRFPIPAQLEIKFPPPKKQ